MSLRLVAPVDELFLLQVVAGIGVDGGAQPEQLLGGVVDDASYALRLALSVVYRGVVHDGVAVVAAQSVVRSYPYIPLMVLKQLVDGVARQSVAR